MIPTSTGPAIVRSVEADPSAPLGPPRIVRVIAVNTRHLRTDCGHYSRKTGFVTNHSGWWPKDRIEAWTPELQADAEQCARMASAAEAKEGLERKLRGLRSMRSYFADQAELSRAELNTSLHHVAVIDKEIDELKAIGEASR